MVVVDFGGGGATDFRIVGGTFDLSASLMSRIIVAGGGAGNGVGIVYGSDEEYFRWVRSVVLRGGPGLRVSNVMLDDDDGYSRYHATFDKYGATRWHSSGWGLERLSDRYIAWLLWICTE